MNNDQEIVKLSPEDDFMNELLKGINKDICKIVGKEKTLEIQEAINNRLQKKGLQEVDGGKVDNV